MSRNAILREIGELQDAIASAGGYANALRRREFRPLVTRLADLRTAEVATR